MRGDNGLNLPMTKVVRSWSMRPGLTCTTECYCPIYSIPFIMSWLGAHCSLVFRCSMSRNGDKESCDSSLLIRLCLYCCPSITIPYVSLVVARKSSSNLLKEAIVSPSYFIKNTTMTNITFFKFHFLMTIGKIFFLEVFMLIYLLQSWCDEFRRCPIILISALDRYMSIEDDLMMNTSSDV